MAKPDVDDLLALVDVFYETAMDNDGWDRALSQLAKTLDGTAAVFFVQDHAAAQLNFGRLWGLPAEAMDEYESEFSGLDIGVADLMERGEGTVLTEEAISPRVRGSSPFFNDFREKWTIPRYLAGTVFHDHRRVGVLAVQGESRRHPFDDVDRRFLQRLLPHVQRSVQLRSQIDGLAHAKSSFEDLTENLSTGVVLLDELADTLFANAAARRVFSRNDGLTIVDRKLCANSAVEDRRISQSIRKALLVSSRAGIEASGSIAVSRAFSAQPYNLLILPAGASDRPTLSFGPGRLVVLIGDPDSRFEAPTGLIGRVYGLTRAEATLAHSLASGERLETYAESSQIALSTARWRLKQIQAKTGCRRQADLVRLLLTGPASLLRGGD